MKRTRGTCWMVVPLMTMFALTLVAAEPEAKAPTLEGIVVTPSRVAREIQSTPGVVHPIDAMDAVAREGTRTTPDMLKGVPSVMVQKTGLGQGSPYIRGFTGFRTLCLVDGIRLNNSVFRDGPNQYWNTVDPLSIRDYELVMGPGSVMYGSDAVGGVLNALTLEPPEWNGAADWESRLYYRGATAERSNVGRVQVGSRASEKLGFVAGVSLKDYGDLEGGKDVGRQKHTGYDEQDYDAKISYDPARNVRVTLGHQAVDQDDAWRTHKTIYAIDWEGLSVGDDLKHSYDQHRDLTYLRLRADEMNGAVDALEITVSRQVQSEDLDRVKKDSAGEKQGFDVTTWGVALQLQSDTAVGNWVYGAEYYRDGVDSYARKYKADGSLNKTEIQGPVADDASYDTAGVYVEDTLGLANGKLDLIPGLRFNYAKADADRVKDPTTGKQISVEEDWTDVAGSLRALVPLTPGREHVLFGGISQGFRAPNLSDLTRFDMARSKEIETPSPNLDPENYVACEIGLKSRAGKWISEASYYYTMIDNMIVRTPTGNEIDGNIEVTKKNSGDGYVQGFELSETCLFTPEWSAWVSASWMDGEVDTYPTSDAEKERDTISRLMPPTAQVGARWQLESGKYWAEAVSDMAVKADKLSADDQRDTQRIPPGGTPGYAVFHVRAGTQLTKHLQLSLALENIFDEDYRIHGSGVNEPGRNLIFMANCTF